ncbi:MAG: hypothetical protein O3B27_06085 [Actinomycetota bacterium]|nr:hypothetical protein [Actinomycetota bacterium]MDA2950396.1 hypothetical protein [Actinomycetota bacterium]MDA2991110.1 hypothetical protein [Actinomycetota bacterium]
MTEGLEAIESAPPPRWTHKRLIDMLAACYGTGPRGGVNVSAIADYAGVTPATVYRWIAPGATRYQLGIPQQRIAQLQLPPPIIETRALQQYRGALKAIGKIDAGEPWPEWEAQGWLKPHRVAVVKLHGKPWHQIMINRAHHSRPRSKPAGPIQSAPSGGEINRLRAWQELHRDDITLSQVVVPHWFYAQVLARAVLVRQKWWRVYPLRRQLPIGRTRVWMSDAPPVQLRALGRRAEVPISHFTAG